MGFIARNVSNRLAGAILKLYLPLVGPHSDYTVQFWSPYYIIDILKLEAAQKRIAKMIPNIQG